MVIFYIDKLGLEKSRLYMIFQGIKWERKQALLWNFVNPISDYMIFEGDFYLLAKYFTEKVPISFIFPCSLEKICLI